MLNKYKREDKVMRNINLDTAGGIAQAAPQPHDIIKTDAVMDVTHKKTTANELISIFSKLPSGEVISIFSELPFNEVISISSELPSSTSRTTKNLDMIDGIDQAAPQPHDIIKGKLAKLSMFDASAISASAAPTPLSVETPIAISAEASTPMSGK
jgi:hypothetical protein